MLGLLKTLILRTIEKRGYSISFGEPATLAGILSAFKYRDPEFFFVQIGAYDGQESDPLNSMIKEYKWKGILIEPQPEAFARLKENYSSLNGLIFENVAIAAEEGSLPFFRLRNTFSHLFHADYGTLASFDANHILKHLSTPNTSEDVLEAIQISCMPLSKLLDKHQVNKIDLLQIDAEGYDYQILQMIPFDRIKPRVIRFEHANLCDTDKNAAMHLLLQNCYKLVIGSYDVTAFQSKWMYD